MEGNPTWEAGPPPPPTSIALGPLEMLQPPSGGGLGVPTGGVWRLEEGV